MEFEFECPHGHVLQADEADIGRLCACPTCGTRFEVPAPPRESIAADLEEHASAPVLHVPCPAGHVLETPRDMLGKYAQCPTCGARFQLSASDSIEVRRQRDLGERGRLRRSSRTWLYRAITLAIVVTLAITLLIVMALNN